MRDGLGVFACMMQPERATQRCSTLRLFDKRHSLAVCTESSSISRQRWQVTGVCGEGHIPREAADVRRASLSSHKHAVGFNIRQQSELLLEVVSGGSGIDAAKAVALMVGHNESLWDLEDVGDNWRRANAEVIPPIVAIPTTAGTGTEVGRAAVIVNEASQSKTIIFHPKLLPSIVILDPTVTVSLPMHLTAATGMDALSHSIEAFCSPLYHPMAEGIALEGIRLVKEFLFKAVTDGGDLEARTQMLVASTMGATAFQRGLGAMHALAHPLGAIFDAHHGTLNAILMPYVLKANRGAITGPMRRLSRYLGLGETGVDGVLEWVLHLREALAIPVSLAAIGIDDRVTDRIGELAVSDPSAATNPIMFSPEQYRKIFLEALGQ